MISVSGAVRTIGAPPSASDAIMKSPRLNALYGPARAYILKQNGRFRRLNLDLGRVLSRGDSLLHERVPVMTMRALPEQLGTAIATTHAHMGIQVEHRMARQLRISVHERRRVMQLRQRP